jgi:hypothetical protein
MLVLDVLMDSLPPHLATKGKGSLIAQNYMFRAMVDCPASLLNCPSEQDLG